MTNVTNPAALLRSVIIYGVSIVLAVVGGYAIVNVANSNLTDLSSLGTIGLLLAVMAFPLLMKWHYPLLVFSVSLPATMFFLPGHPSMFFAMVAVSLSISVLERILDRNQRFLPAGGVQWPLLAMLLVVIVTAKLTGGFGMRSFGSDVYGGKKYIFLIIGIVSFFAFIARPIPRQYVNWYLFLYFGGGIFKFIQDFYTLIPSPFHFIFYVFPPLYNSMVDDWQLGVTRLSGISGAAGSVLLWLLARYGIRNIFYTAKIWRPALLMAALALTFLGGFRTSIITITVVMALLFYQERMQRTGLMLVVLLGGLMGGTLLVSLSSHLPYTFQRELAFLPLNISPAARMDAEASTQWRLDMWNALLPEVPKYLLKGKGYSFSQETYIESMGMDAEFQRNIDAAQNPLALSSDFHSGPLSVVIPFGIWGVLAFVWFMAAGFLVVWRNFRYGDPELGHINRFFLALYMNKCLMFLFVFGGMSDDVGDFAAMIGFSIAVNHGVMKRLAYRRNPAAPASLAFPARPVLQPWST